MPAGEPYIRMICPGVSAARIDVIDSQVQSRKDAGWIPDPFPDRRPEHHTKWTGCAKGRVGVVVANGPSAADVSPSCVRALSRAGALVMACNAAWACPCLNGVEVDGYVVIDDTFWSGHREKARQWMSSMRRPPLPFFYFSPEEDIDYAHLPIDIGRYPEDSLPYEPGVLFNGQSSGCAAAQLAMQAGCSMILLIGHDCTNIGAKTHAWGVRNSDELNNGYIQGGAMLPGYAALAKHAEQIGICVYNLSPGSAIESIPKKHPELAISRILEGKQSGSLSH